MKLERFTEKAQEAFQEAQEIMHDQHHTQLDVEHIFLAMLRQREGLTARAIVRLAVDADLVAQRVERELEKSPKVYGQYGYGNQVYITPRTQRLVKRAEDEANAFVKVLQEQRERILKTRTKHDREFEQLAFGFADHELRQLRDNRSYWDKRLARIERDLELEPAAIRRTFEVATAPRIEPAGAIVLWPLEATR